MEEKIINLYCEIGLLGKKPSVLIISEDDWEQLIKEKGRPEFLKENLMPSSNLSFWGMRVFMTDDLRKDEIFIA